MKKWITLFGALLAVTALTACSSHFSGSRMGNDSQLIMDFKSFNMTDSQELSVEAGGQIHVELAVKRGRLSYKILKDGREPVAEAEDILSSESVDIAIEEGGIYTVAITGKKARGSAEFTVENP